MCGKVHNFYQPIKKIVTYYNLIRLKALVSTVACREYSVHKKNFKNSFNISNTTNKFKQSFKKKTRALLFTPHISPKKKNYKKKYTFSKGKPSDSIISSEIHFHKTQNLFYPNMYFQSHALPFHHQTFIYITYM